MERELDQVRRRGSVVTFFERLGDPSMDGCSSIGRQRVVQRLPDEVVGEPVPSGHAGDRLQEAGLYGLVERIDGLVRVVIREAEQRLDAEFGSDHGAHRECGCGGGAQVADATRDYRLHTGRNRDPERRQVRDIAESTLGRQQSHRLPDEQWVAAGRPPHGCHQAVMPPDVHGPTEIVGDGICGQAAERHRASVRVARELIDGGGQRVLRGQLNVPIGPHHQERHVAQLTGQEAQQQDRWSIRRLQIVEDDQDGAVARGVAQKHRRRIEEPETRRVGLAVTWRRKVRDEVAKFGQHLGDIAGARPEVTTDVAGLGRPQVGPQRLDPRPVRWRAGVFPAATPQDEMPQVPSAVRQLVRQSTLTDAGLAADEHQVATT